MLDIRPWRWRWYVPTKRRFIYGLHGAISQKVTTFIAIVVRTSNSTQSLYWLRNIPNLVEIRWIGFGAESKAQTHDLTEIYFMHFVNMKSALRMCPYNTDTRVMLHSGKVRSSKHGVTSHWLSAESEGALWSSPVLSSKPTPHRSSDVSIAMSREEAKEQGGGSRETSLYVCNSESSLFGLVSEIHSLLDWSV
jgi:hypothetical protein